MEKLRLPCKIGDIVYTIESKYGNRKVKSVVVDGFIVDEIGVHPAEMTHDGWEKIGFYNGEKCYLTEEEAKKNL